MAYITFEHIDQYYGSQHVLKDLNLSVGLCHPFGSFWLRQKYPVAMLGRLGTSITRSHFIGWGRYHAQSSPRAPCRDDLPAIQSVSHYDCGWQHCLWSKNPRGLSK